MTGFDRRWFACVAVMLALSWSSLGHAARPNINQGATTRRPPTSAKTIRVNGIVNACYKPRNFVVFITSVPRGRFESNTKHVNQDGSFTFIFDAAQIAPGDYFVNYGKTKWGAGGTRFTVKIDSVKIDLGVLGDCDL